MSIFNLPEGWKPPPKEVEDMAYRLAKRIIDDFNRQVRLELNTEILLTEHFYHNNIHFKMYLN